MPRTETIIFRLSQTDMENRFITNPKITEYIDGFYRPLTPGLGKLRDESEAAGIPVILRDTEKFLITMLTMIGPKRVLEIGTATGFSSSCFACALGPEAEVVTIEKDRTMAETARANIERLGYSATIDVVCGDACDEIVKLDGTFDFVFIDAAKSHYLEFWNAAFEHVECGSVIVCDNILMRGSTASDEYDSSKGRHRTSIRRMRAFLESITNDERCVTSLLASGDGISVSVVR